LFLSENPHPRELLALWARAEAATRRPAPPTPPKATGQR